MEKIIKAQNIRYQYKQNNEEPILNNVSATFYTERFYAIIGPSGSGKTTFLSLLAGLDNPVEGRVLYNGQDIRETGLNMHRQKHVSLVFQNYNLLDYLTVEENVKLGGKKNVQALLQQVGIPQEAWKRSVLQLSGGQQQRVAIARALASDAQILLDDEPTGNLDEDTAKEIIQLLKNTAHQQGKCVIVVTHSRQLAQEADVILEMNYGTLTKR